MPTQILVENIAEGKFRVTLLEGRSQSSHVITLKADYYQKLTAGKIGAEELVRRSFEFLLEREPKDSILTEFDLPVIGRYFPEYETEIRKRAGAL